MFGHRTSNFLEQTFTFLYELASLFGKRILVRACDSKSDDVHHWLQQTRCERDREKTETEAETETITRRIRDGTET